jgi:lauroyl/myristoyl acyltransferase
MVNLGSLHANKHAETLIQTVSERFSLTTDLNVRFVCCLVTPAGIKYYGIIEPPSAFAVSMEAMRQQDVNTLANMFSCNVAEMIRLVQD